MQLIQKLESMLELEWTEGEKQKLLSLIGCVKKYKWFIPQSLELVIVDCLDMCKHKLEHYISVEEKNV